MMTWLKGKKTYVVAMLMSGIGLVDMLTSNLSFAGIMDFVTSDSMGMVLEGFGLGTLRAGVAKMMK